MCVECLSSAAPVGAADVVLRAALQLIFYWPDGRFTQGFTFVVHLTTCARI
jgi:hypothetical protein